MRNVWSKQIVQSPTFRQGEQRKTYRVSRKIHRRSPLDEKHRINVDGRRTSRCENKWIQRDGGANQRTSRKWFSESAWNYIRRCHWYAMRPTALDVIQHFRFVYPARRSHWKRSETIKQYTPVALAAFQLKTLWKSIENTWKWLKSNKLPIGQEKSIYRVHPVRTLWSRTRICSNESFWILQPDEIPSVRRIDCTHNDWSGYVHRISKYSSCEMIDRSHVSADESLISCESWVLTNICLFFLKKRSMSVELRKMVVLNIQLNTDFGTDELYISEFDTYCWNWSNRGEEQITR